MGLQSTVTRAYTNVICGFYLEPRRWQAARLGVSQALNRGSTTARSWSLMTYRSKRPEAPIGLQGRRVYQPQTYMQRTI